MNASPAPEPEWLDRQVAEVARPEHSAPFGTMVRPGPNARRSAVLVLFGHGQNGTDVLLTQRASTLRSHAGQVAFPGGRLDPEDAGPAAAAVREAHEEAGVDPAGVSVRAECAELFLHVTNFRVTPVIGWWHEPSPLRPGDPGEVERVVRVPLNELVDPANRFAVSYRGRATGPGFTASGLFIWGFTAGVLSWLIQLAGLERPWDSSRKLEVPAQQVGLATRQELKRALSDQQGLDGQDASGPSEVEVP